MNEMDRLTTPVKGLVLDLNWKIMRLKYESQSLQFSQKDRFKKKRELDKALKEREFWLQGGKRKANES